MPAKRVFASVKLDTEAIRLAKIVAAYRGTDMANYLSDRLLPLLRADLAQHQKDEQKQQNRD
ncbi:MAG TPA: hypothetical protein VH682_14020 [Gemmataceae bacterium]|jgi:hypothetical protein